MKKHAEGWSLQQFKVTGARRLGTLVKLEMEFVESPPANWKGSSIPMRRFSMRDQSVWELIDGNWYAWETGQRQHLPLNAAIVSPNPTPHPDARGAADSIQTPAGAHAGGRER